MLNGPLDGEMVLQVDGEEGGRMALLPEPRRFIEPYTKSKSRFIYIAHFTADVFTKQLYRDLDQDSKRKPVLLWITTYSTTTTKRIKMYNYMNVISHFNVLNLIKFMKRCFIFIVLT